MRFEVLSGSKKGRRSQSGGVLIDLLIVIPVIVGGIFFILWWGLTLSSQASIFAALGQSTRLAATHGNLGYMGNELGGRGGILDTFIQDGMTGNSALEAVFIHHPVTGQVTDVRASAVKYYDKCFAKPVFDVTLKELPIQYSYALFYLNQSVASAMGAMVRFPCKPWRIRDFCADYDDQDYDPHDVNSTDLDGFDGPGCMGCVALNPDSIGGSDDGTFNEASVFMKYSTTSGDDPIPENRIAIRCYYQSAPAPLVPALRLIGAFRSPHTQPLFAFNKTMFFSGAIVHPQ